MDLDQLDSLQQEIEADDDPRRYNVRIRIGNQSMFSDSDAERLGSIEAALRALGVRIERQGDLQTYIDVENLNLDALPSGAVKEALISLHSQLDESDNETYNVVRAAIQLGFEAFQETT